MGRGWHLVYDLALADAGPLNWGTANEQRVRLGSAIRLGLGLFVAILGLTVF